MSYNQNDEPDEFALPGWVTSPGFLFGLLVFVIFIAPKIYFFAMDTWDRAMNGPLPPQACYEFNKNSFFANRLPPKKHDSAARERDKKFAQLQAQSVLENFASCPYGTCKRKKFSKYDLNIQDYLNNRREMTYFYNRDDGPESVEFVNSIYRTDPHRRIYAYLQGGFETDELSWLALNGTLDDAAKAWLVAKGGDMKVCEGST